MYAKTIALKLYILLALQCLPNSNGLLSTIHAMFQALHSYDGDISFLFLVSSIIYSLDYMVFSTVLYNNLFIGVDWQLVSMGTLST